MSATAKKQKPLKRHPSKLKKASAYTILTLILISIVAVLFAFPKVKDASCLMTQAPGPVDTLQLEELGIELSTPEEE